jgi:hypothetical protein
MSVETTYDCGLRLLEVRTEHEAFALLKLFSRTLSRHTQGVCSLLSIQLYLRATVTTLPSGLITYRHGIDRLTERLLTTSETISHCFDRKTSDTVTLLYET